MILQALYKYYQRQTKEQGGIAPEGLEKKEIPFLIIIDRNGSFVDFQDTRQIQGKKKIGRNFTIPKAIKRTVGISANLLWDNPAYVLGIPKTDKTKDYDTLLKRAKKQHAAFITRIRETFSVQRDEGIQAVLAFLERGDYSRLSSHPIWKEVEESASNLTFQLTGDIELVCQRSGVLSVISKPGISNESELQTCLVTGESDIPVRLHTAIKGVWGAQSSGANIVSFNLDAFNSYAKTQGYNAPVGKKAESAYTTALNTLLSRDSTQRIQVGDTSTVFWAAQKNPMENLYTDFFGEKVEVKSIQDNESLKALYNAPQSGAPPLQEDRTPFYVLGLSPNAARIAVRFWYAGTVGDVAKNIIQYFDDTTIVHSPWEPEHQSLFRLLVSTAVQGKSENIQPNLAGDIMKSILYGTPYPQTLLGAVIIRMKAEQSKKDKKTGKSVLNVTYPRAALIKAVLNRELRFYKKTEKEVGMSLDTENTNPGYRLGRLFAVLERVQERASPNLNATIRERFYGSASSTPVVAFPHLLKLKNYHIAKLENKGEAVNYEKRLGEIMDGLIDFPAHLSLTDQGRFAIGYYHERQSFFSK
jgi:CRISPR-associated protein Csd1